MGESYAVVTLPPCLVSSLIGTPHAPHFGTPFSSCLSKGSAPKFRRPPISYRSSRFSCTFVAADWGAKCGSELVGIYPVFVASDELESVDIGRLITLGSVLEAPYSRRRPVFIVPDVVVLKVSDLECCKVV